MPTKPAKPTKKPQPTARSTAAAAKAKAPAPAKAKLPVPAPAKVKPAAPAKAKPAAPLAKAKPAAPPAKVEAPAKAKEPTAEMKRTGVTVRAKAPILQKVAFTMFAVQDATRARAFYEDILGLTRGLASPEGTWTEYDLPGGGCLALFCHPKMALPASGGASIAFEVADLDAVNTRLAAAGVTYLGEMVHGPNCRMSNIKDSEGNGIILHQLTRAT